MRATALFVVSVVVVGAHTTAGQLSYCGVFGAGLTEAARQLLTEALLPLQRNASRFNHVPPTSLRTPSAFIPSWSATSSTANCKDLFGTLRGKG